MGSAEGGEYPKQVYASAGGRGEEVSGLFFSPGPCASLLNEGTK